MPHVIPKKPQQPKPPEPQKDKALTLADVKAMLAEHEAHVLQVLALERDRMVVEFAGIVKAMNKPRKPARIEFDQDARGLITGARVIPEE